MRRALRAALVFSAAATLLAGCHSRTEIVLGVITDLKAPDLLDQVHLEVRHPNEPASVDPLIAYDWTIPGIPNQPFILPGSFGLYSGDGSEPRIKITLTGLRNGQVKVTRSSVLSLISEQTLFLRQSLVAGCVDDTDCQDANNQTCVEGTCVDNRIDAHMLPKFKANLVTEVSCDSGSQFLNTSTNQPIPPSGTCGSGQFCQEGTCYAAPALSAASWHGLSSGTTSDLQSVIATPAGSLYAVGKGGTIVSLGPAGLGLASAWNVEQSGTTQDLFAVWSSDPAYVYAVGANGTILDHDSGGWHPDSTASGVTGDLHGLWGDNTGTVWAVGGASGQGVAYLFAGMWSSLSLPAGTGELTGISGTSGTDIWMVGKKGTLLHFNGDTFAPGPTSPATSGEDFTAVWATPQMVYVAAASGKLYALQQGSLTPIDLGGNSNPLTAIVGFGPDDIYVVGSGGAIYHGGPLNFTSEIADTPVSLFGVAGTSPEDVYAVGKHGAILHTGAGAPASDGGVPPDLGPSACASTQISTLVTGMSPPDSGVSTLWYPAAMAYDATSQALLVFDGPSGNLFSVDPNKGTITPVSLQGATVMDAYRMVASRDSLVPGSDLWVLISNQSVVRKLTPYMGGMMLGTSYGSSTGFQDGVSDGAQFNNPIGIAVDPAGNIYIADAGNHAIRKIDTSGFVSTLAGNGTQGSADGSGATPVDGGQPLFGTARFEGPNDIFYDAASQMLYVADAGKLRKVDPTTGTTTTLTTISVATPFVYLTGDGAGNLYGSDAIHVYRYQVGSQATSVLVQSSLQNGNDGDGCTGSFAGLASLVADPKVHRLWAADESAGYGRIRTITFP